MMSNISDERLIVAAVKDGDSEALEELKKRAVSGEHGIRAVLKRKQWQFSDEEINCVEEKILERISDNLPSYNFSVSFQSWVFRNTINQAIQHQYENAKETLDNKCQEEIDQSKVQPITKDLPIMPIDFEIRPLVGLLNQSPAIKIFTSCSGHPDQQVWEGKRGWVQHGGWIGISPTGDPSRALDFLVSLLSRLDNTHSINTTETISNLYKQADAETLFCSSGPIAIVKVSLRFFVSHHEVEKCIQIWKQFIACLKELIPDYDELTTEVNTPVMVAQCIQKALHLTPFVYYAKLETSSDGKPCIVLKTIADLPLLKWFLVLSQLLHEHFDIQQNTPFTTKWSFELRPFLNQELIPLPHLLTPQWEPRTREDHLKIWKLLELAVTEQLESEGITVKTDNN